VTRSADNKTLFLKMVNSGPDALKINLDLGKVIPAGTASGWVLTHSDPEETNTADDPARVSPKTLTWKDVQPKITRELPAWSLTVVSITLL
jgi:alpha-L-arabinofuranosidase